MSISSLIRYVALILLMLPMFGNTATIAAGYNHTCALTSAGDVQCWGNNQFGKLGDGTATDRLVPVAVSGLSSGVKAIAVGDRHACALTMIGGVQCWGANYYGQLGAGTVMEASLVPVVVNGLSSDIQMIAVGYEHSCALTAAGGVQCWGNNSAGQLGDGTTTQRLTPVTVSSLSSGVQAIVAGGFHTCALTVAGGVLCWGSNDFGKLGDGTQFTNRLTPVAVTGLSSGMQVIAAGANHTCALATVGGMKCWGANWDGQLGDGTTTSSRLTPVAVTGLNSGVQAIAIGDRHTCVQTAIGGVQCWGNNSAGQLGDGTITRRYAPGEVSNLSSGVQAITAGNNYTCIVTTVGGVQCWGNNSAGQLGDGTTDQRNTPVAARFQQSINMIIAAPALGVIGVGFPVVASSNSGLPVAITAAGGCVLDGNTVTMTSVTPFCTLTYTQPGNAEYAAATVSTITSVDSDGDGVPNAVDVDDDNDGAQDSFDIFPFDVSEVADTDDDGIGNNIDTDDDNDTVEDATDNCPLIANFFNQRDSNANGKGYACQLPPIAVGSSHTCALTTTGGLQCWGFNDYGELGDGTTTQKNTPVTVNELDSGVQSIVASSLHTCALTTAGGVKCWGSNTNGQLGDGTNINRLTPVVVSGLSSGVQTIATSYFHTCALTMAGGVQCWGFNNRGQLGDGTTTTRLTPVDVSGLSSGAVAITVGAYHSCALMSAGGVQCWGYNYHGELGDGTVTNSLTPVTVNGLSRSVVAIAAGSYHSCALMNVGEVQCWGGNWSGQLGDGTTTQRLAPVTISGLSDGVQVIVPGAEHTCALMITGEVKCWGQNSKGQLGDGTTTRRLSPVAVSGLSGGAQALAAADYHSCALMAAGVKCWGYNGLGQLGDGTTINRLIPVFVVGRDNDGDGVLDGDDAFPLDATESIDTDNDGIGNNADMDDDGDNVPDYIDADPLNAAVNSERLMQLNGGYQGSSINESALTNQ